MKQNYGADQLCGYRTADLRFCFRMCKRRFSYDAAQIQKVLIRWLVLQLTGIFDVCRNQIRFYHKMASWWLIFLGCGEWAIGTILSTKFVIFPFVCFKWEEKNAIHW